MTDLEVRTTIATFPVLTGDILFANLRKAEDYWVAMHNARPGEPLKVARCFPPPDRVELVPMEAEPIRSAFDDEPSTAVEFSPGDSRMS